MGLESILIKPLSLNETRFLPWCETDPVAKAMAVYTCRGPARSTDGIHFVVPMKTLHARFNRKYFGRKPGMTWYNFTSNQYSGFHGMVVPGTLRDFLFLLGGLLEQQASLQPKEIMTDTHDMVFGLFHLLDYQFSPRFADVDYGALQNIARFSIAVSSGINQHQSACQCAGTLSL